MYRLWSHSNALNTHPILTVFLINDLPLELDRYQGYRFSDLAVTLDSVT